MEGSFPQFAGVTLGQSVCSVVSANSALTSPQPASPNDQVYSCDQCGHEANVTVDLKKHKAEVHKNSAYTCDQCKYMANKTEYQKKHMAYEHKDSKYYCEQCELENSRTEDLKHHIETQYKAGSWEQYPPVEESIPQIAGDTPGQSVCSVVSADSALTSPQPAGHKDQVYSCDQCGHEANVRLT